MLLARPASRPAVVLDATSMPPLDAGFVWLDLVEPTDDERALASRLSNLRVPSRSDLAEIESSSRVYREAGALYMSTPLTRRRNERTVSAPIGFVLNDRHLLTVRFYDYPSFDTYGAVVAKSDSPSGSHALFVGLFEAIVDRAADVLEMVAADLDRVGGSIFHSQEAVARRKQDQLMRDLLRRVGGIGDTVSLLRDTLLGLTRMHNFVSDTMNTVEGGLRVRVDTIGRDLRSLSDFDSQLTNKVQFLLDATLGFINIEQNNGIKVLTVVSIVGIPPTLIASIYGMNFKDIPELNWAYGYPYALCLMVASVVLPLIWFKRSGYI